MTTTAGLVKVPSFTTAGVLPRSISAERLLPAEALETLEALRGSGDAQRWAIGDVTAALVTELRGQVVDGAKLTAKDIRAAVADAVGLTPSTVRQYETVAEFYPLDHRQVYGVLTYTYFREALVSVAPWLALEWAVASADDFGGKVAPVRVLKAKIAAERGDKQPPTFAALVAVALAHAERVRDAADTERKRAIAREAVERFEQLEIMP